MKKVVSLYGVMLSILSLNVGLALACQNDQQNIQIEEVDNYFKKAQSNSIRDILISMVAMDSSTGFTECYEKYKDVSIEKIWAEIKERAILKSGICEVLSFIKEYIIKDESKKNDESYIDTDNNKTNISEKTDIKG